MRVISLFALAAAIAFHGAAAEKGDTYSAPMTAAALPEGAGFVPPTGKVSSKEKNG